MGRRDAERRARKFIARYYSAYAHWNFDITEETAARRARHGKVWSFGLRPDEEDADYEPGARFIGYVHADGAIEGLY